MNNPYKVLGVEDNAPLTECKKAYRLLSRKYHPDNNGDANKFHEVTKAWEMIESGEVKNMILVGNSRTKFLHHKGLFSFSI